MDVIRLGTVRIGRNGGHGRPGEDRFDIAFHGLLVEAIES